MSSAKEVGGAKLLEGFGGKEGRMVNSSESLSSSSWSNGSLGHAYLVRRTAGEYGSVYELDRHRRMGIGRATSRKFSRALAAQALACRYGPG